MNFQTIIGLEVHAQLATQSKMFCSCSVDYANTAPNSYVCPVCLGMPGVLPVINRQAVELTVMTALALHCTISNYARFDRKNYPYPDLMKGYQISQNYFPFGQKGWLSIEVEGQKKRVGISNVHLEEDTAKLTHQNAGGESFSVVDVNRSGTPLMEIVGDPDLRSPEEARQYLMTLRAILQYLGVSTANMEEGSFRCDANISVLPEGATKTTAKVEVKNMNSFRAVYRALEYEAERIRKAVIESTKLVQETRGWVEEQGKTVSQRSKEYAHDYRYFPEPDLPPMVLTNEYIEGLRAKLPELPEARRGRFFRDYGKYGVTLYDASLLVADKAVADHYEEGMKANPEVNPKDYANLLIGPIQAELNLHNIGIAEYSRSVPPQNTSGLVIMISGGMITASTGKIILNEMYETKKPADEIIKAKGLSQISDTGEIEAAIVQVISNNPQPVVDYKAGKAQAMTFLVGQVMRATKGRANAKLVNELMKKKLEEG